MSGGQSARGTGALAPLDELDAQLLELVARLPLAPPWVIADFSGGGRSLAYRHLRSLLERSLVSALLNPWRTSGRPARLLYTTRLGLDALVRSGAIDPQYLVGQSGADHVQPGRLLADLPGRLAAYELLGLLAAAHPGEVTLMNWERPWRRVIGPTGGAAGRTAPVVRLPAAATLAWTRAEGTIVTDYLLVPDTGGLAIPALGTSLARLGECQAKVPGSPATLIIATTTARRAAAWTRLLVEIGSTCGPAALGADVSLWEELRRLVQKSRGSVLGSLPSSVLKPASGNSGAHVGNPCERRLCDWWGSPLGPAVWRRPGGVRA